MASLIASRTGFVVLIAACLIATASPSAQAAWPHDPNVNVPLCTAASTQEYPTIVADGAGGAIVTWHDFRSGTNYDIYAQHVLASGGVDPAWPADGRALCTAAFDQQFPTIVADGAGGAIVTWHDFRSGTTKDIYAQHVLASGGVDPAWPADGRALCTAASYQQYPAIVADGAGGAIVTWYDYRTAGIADIYAQHVLASGGVDPAWPADGRALCTAANHQYNPTIVADGAGGAIVTWYDYRNGFADIYAQHVLASGGVDPAWPADGRALCTAANEQSFPKIVADGAGGAIVSWYDYRSGNIDIYAQRVSSGGAPLWPSNGVAVCTSANDQQRLAIASDGAGGAIVAWDDYRGGLNYDVYAQRVAPSGIMSWTLNGVAVSTAASDQQSPSVVSDGAGGCILAWNDIRGGISYDIYAQRVTAAGVPQWTADGVAICLAAVSQNLPVAAIDGSGGAIVAWYDNRGGLSTDIYAQRVEHFGYLGNPEPTIARVRDVTFDNGGQVKVSWYPSWLDGVSDYNLYAYDIYRSAPTSIAEQAVRQGAHRLSGFGEMPPVAGRSFVVSPDAAQLYAWEYLASVSPTHFLPVYGYIAPTTTDSIAAGNPKTIFMVVGKNYGGSIYWLSPPDSGYSVDNLPPMIPAPFTGAYSAGATHLHWGNNSESDLSGYRLYRGASSGFIPGPGNLISAQPDTGHADPGPAGSWYKLSAQDSHGNESVYAVLGPNGTLDTPGTTVPALAFSPPAPNPVRSEGATFRIALPEAAHVTLTLFDEQGRRVRDLERGTLPAGEHGVRWDGRDVAGHAAASGIYFARLETMGRTLRVRFAVVR